jgi:hypothetical protein
LLLPVEIYRPKHTSKNLFCGIILSTFYGTKDKYNISRTFVWFLFKEVSIMTNKEKLIKLINSINDEAVIEYLLFFIIGKFFGAAEWDV